jgi:hypothetical protein
MSTPKVAKITNAGLAAANDADIEGVQIQITHIAFGDGAAYTPTGTETALVNERQRVPITGYVRLSNTAHKVLGEVIATTVDNEYSCTEIGFFLSDGTLFAVYSPGTGNIVYIDSEVSFVASFTLNLSGVPTGSVTVTVDPTASATLALIAAHETSLSAHAPLLGPRGIQAFSTPGAHTFTVPANVWSLDAEAWGGGGGGAKGSSAAHGEGGGSGAYARKVLSVEPGATVSITVGAGGVSYTGSGGAAGNGGDTTLSVTIDGVATVVTAGGGEGATVVVADGGSRGTGGTATGGDINISGQNGADGVDGTMPSGIGGSAPFGGNGGLPDAVSNSAAQWPGGGGAGGAVAASDGANGGVILKW